MSTGNVYAIRFTGGFVKVGYSERNSVGRVASAKNFIARIIPDSEMIDFYVSPDVYSPRKLESVIVNHCKNNLCLQNVFGANEWFLTADDGKSVIDFVKGIDYNAINKKKKPIAEKQTEEMISFSNSIILAALNNNDLAKTSDEVEKQEMMEFSRKYHVALFMKDLTSETIRLAVSKAKTEQQKMLAGSIENLADSALVAIEQIALFASQKTLDDMTNYLMQARIGKMAYSIRDGSNARLLEIMQECEAEFAYDGSRKSTARMFVATWHVVISFCADIIAIAQDA